MSEFPEIFPLDEARAIAQQERSPEVLARWLVRAIEEVEKLHVHSEGIIAMLHESECKVSGLEARERLRLFKEKYGRSQT